MIEYITAWVYARIGTLRDERGLTQSTENVLLVVGASVIALAIVATVTGYVNGKLGGLR